MAAANRARTLRLHAMLSTEPGQTLSTRCRPERNRAKSGRSCSAYEGFRCTILCGFAAQQTGGRSAQRTTAIIESLAVL
eukprot:4482942-Pleurochrysis_carterae.AAC.2